MNSVRIDQLANRIARAVQDYTEEVSEAVSEAVDTTAKECLAEIKANSRGFSPDYAKGWKIVKDKRRGMRGLNRNIIWNPARYRTVHLLEKGHAKRGGGRVQAYPHVGPAEQKYVDKLQEQIYGIISRGG